MLDPIHIYNLLNINWKSKYDNPIETSDISKIGKFAREFNLTLLELSNEFEKFKLISKDKFNTNYLNIWIKRIDKSERQQNPEGYLLKSQLFDSSNTEYRAFIKKNSKNSKLLITFKRRIQDNSFGRHTGIPNIVFWSDTPGQYYLETIMDNYYNGRNEDILCIDGGSNWNVYGLTNLRSEIHQKFEQALKDENELE